MPVTTKERLKYLNGELSKRFGQLYHTVASRALSSNKEGAGRGHWAKPELMCGTVGSKTEISLAVEDFKAILAEIKRLK